MAVGGPRRRSLPGTSRPPTMTRHEDPDYSMTAAHEALPSRQLVLVVDDDPAVGRLLDVILAREGYRCTLAGTISEARECLSRGTFDVMVCDVRLPDGSGLD